MHVPVPARLAVLAAAVVFSCPSSALAADGTASSLPASASASATTPPPSLASSSPSAPVSASATSSPTFIHHSGSPVPVRTDTGKPTHRPGPSASPSGPPVLAHTGMSSTALAVSAAGACALLLMGGGALGWARSPLGRFGKSRRPRHQRRH